MASYDDVLLLCAAAFGQGAGKGEIDISLLVALKTEYGKRIEGHIETWEQDKDTVLAWCFKAGAAAREAAGTSALGVSQKSATTKGGPCPYCTG
jgi:hypothetical protein